jgi:hypothetical protein
VFILLRPAQLQLLTGPQGVADAPPSLQLAVGFATALYHLRATKSLSLPRAAALTTLGLIFGTSFGGAVESVARVDIVPLFG